MQNTNEVSRFPFTAKAEAEGWASLGDLGQTRGSRATHKHSRSGATVAVGRTITMEEAAAAAARATAVEAGVCWTT